MRRKRMCQYVDASECDGFHKLYCVYRVGIRENIKSKSFRPISWFNPKVTGMNANDMARDNTQLCSGIQIFYSSTHYIHRTSYGHPYDVQWISIWISIGCPLDNLWMWIWIGRGLDVWISYGYPMDVRGRLGGLANTQCVVSFNPKQVQSSWYLFDCQVIRHFGAV